MKLLQEIVGKTLQDTGVRNELLDKVSIHDKSNTKQMNLYQT